MPVHIRLDRVAARVAESNPEGVRPLFVSYLDYDPKMTWGGQEGENRTNPLADPPTRLPRERTRAHQQSRPE